MTDRKAGAWCCGIWEFAPNGLRQATRSGWLIPFAYGFTRLRGRMKCFHSRTESHAAATARVMRNRLSTKALYAYGGMNV